MCRCSVNVEISRDLIMNTAVSPIFRSHSHVSLSVQHRMSVGQVRIPLIFVNTVNFQVYRTTTIDHFNVCVRLKQSAIIIFSMTKEINQSIDHLYV
jgi:RNA:NAD 2'-phosphotransferase (TPT1/KptA family)